MNFLQLQARLYKTIQRDDFLSSNDASVNYGTFINEAIQECGNRKNWTVMKATTDLVITAGTSAVELPTDFKALQNLRPPLHIVFNDPNAGGEILKPVNVTWAEVEYRRLWLVGGLAWDVQTWIERTSTTPILNIASQAGEDLTFRLKYYAYMPVLASDQATNPLELKYPRMVMAKAKEIAFEAINDWEAMAAAGAVFEQLFVRASTQDNIDDVSGREARM